MRPEVLCRRRTSAVGATWTLERSTQAQSTNGVPIVVAHHARSRCDAVMRATMQTFLRPGSTNESSNKERGHVSKRCRERNRCVWREARGNPSKTHVGVVDRAPKPERMGRRNEKQRDQDDQSRHARVISGACRRHGEPRHQPTKGLPSAVSPLVNHAPSVNRAYTHHATAGNAAVR